MMCRELVKEDGKDVRGRNIDESLVTGVCGAESQNLVTASDPQLKELDHLLDQMADQAYSQELNLGLNKEALETTAFSIWNTQLQYVNDANNSDRDVDFTTELGRKRAFNLVCPAQSSCAQNPAAQKVVNDALEKFASYQKVNPTKGLGSLTGQNPNIQKFNKYVTEINAMCADARKEYDKIEAEYRANPYGTPAPQYELKDGKFIVKEAATPKPGEFSFPDMSRANRQNADAAIDNKFGQWRVVQHTYFQKISKRYQEMTETPLGNLLIGEKFRTHVGYPQGDYIYETCFRGSSQLLKPVTPTDVAGGINEFAGLQKTERNRILGAWNPKSKKEQVENIEHYLKHAPLTVVNFLKNNPRPEYADAFCSYIRGINQSDYNWRIFDYAITGVGVVAGVAAIIASGGTAAPAVATAMGLVGIGAGAIEAGSQYFHVQDFSAEINSTMSMVATTQREKEDALAYLSKLEEEKSDASFNMWMAAGGTALGGIGEGAKLVSYLGRAQKAKAIVSVLNMGDEMSTLKVAKAIEEGLGDARYLANSGKFDPKLLNSLNIQESGELGAIFKRLRGNPNMRNEFVALMDCMDQPSDLKNLLRELRGHTEAGESFKDAFAHTSPLRHRIIKAHSIKLDKAFQATLEADVAEVRKVIPEGMGELTYRGKGAASNEAKLVNKAGDGKISQSLHGSRLHVDDGIGTRLILDDTSPETIQKFVDSMSDAIESGDLHVVEIKNYRGVGPEARAYFSDEQIAQLQAAAEKRGYSVEVLSEAKKVKESGYTALQMKVKHASGSLGEWQVRGRKVDELAEIEHLLYDIRTGKGIPAAHNTVEVQQIEKSYSGLSDVLKNEYNGYLNDYFTYTRKLEEGVSNAKAPSLPENLKAYKELDLEHVKNAMHPEHATTANVPTEMGATERLRNTEEALGKTLTPKEAKSVIQSHEVGAGEAGKISGTEAGIRPDGKSNYTYGQIRKKYEVLKEGGFTKDEAKILMDKKLAGSYVDMELEKVIEKPDDYLKLVQEEVRTQLEPVYRESNSMHLLDDEVARQSQEILDESVMTILDDADNIKIQDKESLNQVLKSKMDEGLQARFKGYTPQEAIEPSHVSGTKNIELSYQAKPTDPKSVNFTSEMAEEFNSSSKISKARREVFLQDIQKGVVPAKGSNGIKVVDGPIYEVKNVKDKLRFYGCNVGGVLKIVAVSYNEKDQNAAISRAKSICKGL